MMLMFYSSSYMKALSPVFINLFCDLCWNTPEPFFLFFSQSIFYEIRQTFISYTLRVTMWYIYTENSSAHCASLPNEIGR